MLCCPKRARGGEERDTWSVIILLGRPGPAGHPTTTASESHLSSGRHAGGGHKVTQLVSDG